MLKLLLTFSCFISLLVALGAQSPLGPNSENIKHSRIPLELRIADTLVVCEFRLPEGHVVSEVIAGIKNLKSQNWNSDIFPRQPILIYEITTDHVGDSDRATIVNTTGFYLYDPKSDEVRQTDIHGNTFKVTTLAKIRAARKIASAEQDAAPNLRPR